jgi:hypothetical protein
MDRIIADAIRAASIAKRYDRQTHSHTCMSYIVMPTGESLFLTVVCRFSYSVRIGLEKKRGDRPLLENTPLVRFLL